MAQRYDLRPAQFCCALSQATAVARPSEEQAPGAPAAEREGGGGGDGGGGVAACGRGTGPGAGAGASARRQKAPQLVARRNARERRRVQAVNCAFGRLRRAVPLDSARGKRVSKVKTLLGAIEYIARLEQLLRAGCERAITGNSDLNKENFREGSNRWTSYDAVCGPDSLAQLLAEFQDF